MLGTYVIIFAALAFIGLAIPYVIAITKMKALPNNQESENTIKALPPTPPEFLDVDADIDTSDLEERLSSISKHLPEELAIPCGVAISELSSLADKKTVLLHLVASKFTEGSISRDTFEEPIIAADKAITRNCAVLHNHIKAFDSIYYEFLRDLAAQEKAQSRGKIADTAFNIMRKLPENPITEKIVPEQPKLLDDEQRRMLSILEEEIAGLEELLYDNERLLMGMEELAVNMRDTEMSPLHEESRLLLDELTVLSSNIKKYAA